MNTDLDTPVPSLLARTRELWEGRAARRLGRAGRDDRHGKAIPSSPVPSTDRGWASSLSSSSPSHRELYVAGAKAYAQQKWGEARASFAASWSLHEDGGTAGNLGDCEIQLGMFRDAAEHLAYYLATLPADTTAAERARGEALFAKARAKIAIVRIDAGPEGARVSLDGKALGEAPITAPLYLEPGRLTFEATTFGERATTTLDAVAGSDQKVVLHVKADPGGAVEPPGGIETRTIVIGAGGVLAVGALAGAIVTTVIANGKASDADDRVAALEADGTAGHCPLTPVAACTDIKTLNESSDGAANAARLLYVSAGVIGGATLAYWLLFDSTPAPKASTAAFVATPFAMPGGGGLALSGTY